jgi:hypothetical protein
MIFATKSIAFVGRINVFSGIKISPFEPTGGFETLPYT